MIINGPYFFLVPSGSPTNVESDPSVAKQLSFTWNPPTCGFRNGELTNYEYAFGLDIDEPHYGSTEPDNPMINFANLEHFTKYQYKVRAKTSVGAGPYSDVITTSTAESSK